MTARAHLTVQGETIGFEGGSKRVRLDEVTRKAIAAKTEGEYDYAGSAADPIKVYNKLGSRLPMEKKETEVSGLLALAAAALALLAAGSRCSGSTGYFEPLRPPPLGGKGRWSG